MLKEYKVQSILGIWGGAIAFGIGYLMTSVPSAYQVMQAFLAIAIMLGSYVLFVSGCVMYAKGKGYGGVFGFLGCLGPLGLMILYVLKDKSKIVLKQREKEDRA